MLSYMVPTLDREVADVAVFNIGTNDIPKKLQSSINIARNIIEVGIKCRNAGVREILISSIIRRNHYKLQLKLEEVNSILKIYV